MRRMTAGTLPAACPLLLPCSQGGWGGGPGGQGGQELYRLRLHHGRLPLCERASGDTDGIDSNGDLSISGGVVVVECQMNGGMGGILDSDGSTSITGGKVIGFGRIGPKRERTIA